MLFTSRYLCPVCANTAPAVTAGHWGNSAIRAARDARRAIAVYFAHSHSCRLLIYSQQIKLEITGIYYTTTYLLIGAARALIGQAIDSHSGVESTAVSYSSKR